jgi:C4-dicarboxylate transporter DctM subunit
MMEWTQAVADNRWTFLLLVNVFLLLRGIFLEPLPALVLTAPLTVLAVSPFVWHRSGAPGPGDDLQPGHWALHAPGGWGTLFVAAKIGPVGMGEISRALIPLFLVSLLVLALITYGASLADVSGLAAALNHPPP